MLRRLLRDLALTLAGAIAGLLLLEQFNPDPPRIVVASGAVGMKPEPVDYPLCVTIRPAPLLRTPQGRFDYRGDQHAFNDKGTS